MGGIWIYKTKLSKVMNSLAQKFDQIDYRFLIINCINLSWWTKRKNLFILAIKNLLFRTPLKWYLTLYKLHSKAKIKLPETNFLKTFHPSSTSKYNQSPKTLSNSFKSANRSYSTQWRHIILDFLIPFTEDMISTLCLVQWWSLLSTIKCTPMKCRHALP